LHRAVGHDGRAVGAIRRALDGDGYIQDAIMAYSAKYASAFTDRPRSGRLTPSFGNRRTYQMIHQRREALRRSRSTS